MNDEPQLLRQFATDRSETAFEAIVRLHLNLVFSTALRQVGDHGMAEEITQNVFLALAQKAHTLKWKATIAGWLYQTTLNQARQRLRSEFRRQRREDMAHSISLKRNEGESIWASLIPLLDEALIYLDDRDRLAVILHYIEGRRLREVGAALGVSEDAARKRIHRVVDDLAAWFQKRGFAASTGVLVAALSVQSSSALSISTIASTACASSTGILTGATFSTILMTTTQKIAIAAIIVIACVSIPLALQKKNQPAPSPNSTASPDPIPVVSQTAAIAPEPAPAAAVVPVVAKQEPNIFERINEGDKKLPMLSVEQAEAFLQRNKTNAESLLTAFRVTNDTNYLRQAAEKFPNDPTVIMKALGHNLFPDDRRAWIDQLKKVDPDNAIPSYMSAREHFDKKEYQAAFQDIVDGANKPAFTDYYNEQVLSLEDIYLNAGHTPAEAKALAMAATEIPHLREMRDTAHDMADLIHQYQQSGDSASAQTLIQHGLALATRLQSVRDGGMVLGDLLGVVMERNFVRELDPTQTYPFLSAPIPDRLQELDRHEQSIRDNSEIFSAWIRKAPETDIISYFDRVKLYGEGAAIEWLKQRNP